VESATLALALRTAGGKSICHDPTFEPTFVFLYQVSESRRSARMLGNDEEVASLFNIVTVELHRSQKLVPCSQSKRGVHIHFGHLALFFDFENISVDV
jgi:hypothetical protein